MKRSKSASKSNAALWFVVIILLCIIAALAWMQFRAPAAAKNAKANLAAPSAPAAVKKYASAEASSTAPLSAQVVVSSPVSGASVERSFTVSGVAPNGWYFEAVFPIQVRDGNDDLIATGQGKAESDWTAAGPVPFSATITLDQQYSGPANLILLKDNPSGLPENMDEVTVPIIVI